MRKLAGGPLARTAPGYPGPLELQQAVFHGVLHQGRRVGSTGFIQQVLAVRLHGALAGKELVGDLLVGEPAGYLLQNFPLPVREGHAGGRS